MWGNNAIRPLIAGIVFAMMATSAFCAEPDLRKQVEAHLQDFKAETAGIYYQSFEGVSFEYNADEIFHAASTMKLPVMMQVFRDIEGKKLSLDQKIVVKNEFKSIQDGSPFSLNPEDDSDTDLYQEIGKELPLGNLLERMINSSSNLALNMIIQLVQAPRVMSLMNEIGAGNMTVLRGVEDIKAYDAGKNNTTSARSLAFCLQAILSAKTFNESSRKQMFDILLSQKFKEIGKGINADAQGLQVASKDGFITGIHHDAAIIRDSSGRNSILVVLTRGVEKDEDGNLLVGALANDVWTYYHPKE